MSRKPTAAAPAPAQVFSKPYKTSLELLEHLAACGLTIPDASDAQRKLELIGYHRLRIYFLARRNHGAIGRPFEANVTFDDIIQLYEFDAKLRQICFEPCGTFEVLLRNATADLVSRQFGSHPYDNLAAFSSAKSRLDCLSRFAKLYGDQKDDRSRHYFGRYKEPLLPPIWTMKEMMTFGVSATFLRSLAQPIRNQVSQAFGVHDPEIFDSWINCLVDLRNICAHHDRLFNRSFQKQPGKLIRSNIPTATDNNGKKRLKALLECLDFMVSQRGLPSSLVTDVAALLPAYPAARPAEAGF